MKESTTAPSESEIDLGVFSNKTGNRLEKIFKPKIEISKITPPASPPSKPLDLSPPHPDTKGKGKEDAVEVDRTERVVEDFVACSGRDKVHAVGVETEYESSEATPQGTVYTKRVRGSGCGGVSGSQQGPECHRVPGGSWTTHYPVCDDLLHAPHLTLTQGSKMDNLPNCREFYSLYPPPERLFQKNRHRMDLLDDHIHAGVNFYATTQEIVREWQVMAEDTMDFEAAERVFDAKKRHLMPIRKKQFNADRKKEWEAACERTNQELKATRDEIVRLKGEKTKQSDEHERAVAVYQKRENEYEHQLANLEKVVAEKTAESKASEILAEEISAD
ncbi:hypothetical protein Hanom_Chr07g00650131 [Helianthus anomalus]